MRWQDVRLAPMEYLHGMVSSQSKLTGKSKFKPLSSDLYLARRQVCPPPYSHPDECRTCGANRHREKCVGLLTGEPYKRYQHKDRDANVTRRRKKRVQYEPS